MLPNSRLGTVLLKNTNDRNFQLIVWWDRKLKVPLSMADTFIHISRGMIERNSFLTVDMI